MRNPEYIETIEHQDGFGKGYQHLVEMATQDHWVVPINTDNLAFNQKWHIIDWAQDGHVHYARRR